MFFSNFNSMMQQKLEPILKVQLSQVRWASKRSAFESWASQNKDLQIYSFPLRKACLEGSFNTNFRKSRKLPKVQLLNTKLTTIKFWKLSFAIIASAYTGRPHFQIQNQIWSPNIKKYSFWSTFRFCISIWGPIFRLDDEPTIVEECWAYN